MTVATNTISASAPARPIRGRGENSQINGDAIRAPILPSPTPIAFPAASSLEEALAQLIAKSALTADAWHREQKEHASTLVDAKHDELVAEMRSHARTSLWMGLAENALSAASAGLDIASSVRADAANAFRARAGSASGLLGGAQARILLAMARAAERDSVGLGASAKGLGILSKATSTIRETAGAASQVDTTEIRADLAKHERALGEQADQAASSRAVLARALGHVAEFASSRSSALLASTQRI